MFGLRIPLCFALLIAGCGVEAPIGVAQSALNSCNVDTDCPALTLPGACVKVVCNSDHTCGLTTNLTACATGCTTDLDCSLGTGACYVPTCNKATATPTCDFTVPNTNTCTCQPTDATACGTPSSCQNAATCPFGTCTFTAKAGDTKCCNATADCNTMGTAAHCNQNNNKCACAGTSTYCPTGPSGCVTGTECCQDSDCGSGNTCNDGTCVCGGGEKHCAGLGCIAAGGCCSDTDCVGGGTTSTCNMNNTCVCKDNTQRYCAGAGCVPSTGCCSASDCATRANATAACTSNVCVYTCNGGFHDCSGTCASDTSVMTCGTMCTACPSSADPCLTPACTSGQCGFAPVVGCHSDMGPPPDLLPPPDLAEGPDLATPADLAEPIDQAAPDLSQRVSLSGGGGCAVAGDAAASPRAFVVLVLFLVAFALRRRSA